MEEWKKEASCRNMGPDLFFPEKTKPPNSRYIAALCGGCPVRGECLDYALDNNLPYGIFGGLGERKRRHIKRERQSGCDIL